ncbi:MAG: 30S ribosomal protein S12 methylthiotransferase RimO [Bacillota bacterium]
MMETKATVALINLGCPKNQVDGETMLGILAAAGCPVVSDPAEATVILVNTCGFIDPAKEESIEAIIEAAQYKAGECRALVVSGCLSQRYVSELSRELPEVDAFIGTGELGRIAEVVEAALAGQRQLAVAAPQPASLEVGPRLLSSFGPTAYIKIAEGCDNRCAYCAIPDIRGGYRSRRREAVLEEAGQLVSQGIRELILVAQDTTRYGMDWSERSQLASLLSEVSQLPELRWVRVLYLYPALVDDKLLETVAGSPIICNYLDLPMQHGSDRMLKAMNRRYSADDLRRLVDRCRRIIPDVVLRSSFIVGFPGESETDFEALLELMSDLELDHAGVFTYSREEGTVAASRHPQVPAAVKHERYHRAMTLQREIAARQIRRFIGRNLTVVVEEVGENQSVGRAEKDAPEIDGSVIIDGYHGRPGEFVSVRITGALEYDLLGHLRTED